MRGNLIFSKIMAVLTVLVVASWSAVLIVAFLVLGQK